MIEKFIESVHCKSRTHCKTCRASRKFRESMMKSFDWDGVCPLGDVIHTERPKITSEEIQYQEEVLDRMVKRGCKACEKKRQEAYIQRLKNELD